MLEINKEGYIYAAGTDELHPPGAHMVQSPHPVALILGASMALERCGAHLAVHHIMS